jgi:hypothetical protein
MSPVRYKGGGGGGGTTANVVWGPDFGTEADLVMAGAATMPSLKLTGGVSNAGAASIPNVKLTGGVTGAGAPTLPTVSLVGGVTAASNVTLLQYTTSAILAQKDSWCDVIAACPVDTNRDGSDLQLDGIVATRKDIIVGWDLSGFPTGATVTAATMTLGLDTAPSVGGTLTTNLIATGGETWDETTVKCSNIPAVESAQATTTIATTAGPLDYPITMNAAELTRIGARMGVGTFSLRLTASAALTNCLFESAEGFGSSLGPRLTITFTISA